MEMVWSHPADGYRYVSTNGTDLGSLPWAPEGKRRRRRPPTTWRTTISEELKKAGIGWVKAERMTMSTFFESIPNGTFGFQIQKIRIWIESIESFLIVGFTDSKLFVFGFAENPEQKIHFWIRNPDL